jgi:thioredoxin 1
MKERILTNWTITRAFYLIMGLFVIIQAFMGQQWVGIAFGGYFAAMGLFAFGCASGNCAGGNCSTEPDQNPNQVVHSEEKNNQMTKYLSIILVTVAIIFNSCTNGQSSPSTTSFSATEFSKKITELPGAPIIDVRTPGEFSQGHLKNAVNYDISTGEFEKQIASFDKLKPVLVYCMSGSRSTYAVRFMKSKGFKEVYELNGGMMKWRAANLPETTDITVASIGISKQQFDNMLVTDKLVLIDYYADWCAPCKKMKPYLDAISKDMADKVVVIRINADESRELCKELKIDAIPVLQIYKNKTLIWSNTGFIEKEEVVKQLK